MPARPAPGETAAAAGRRAPAPAAAEDADVLTRLAGLWRQVLGVEPEPASDFFELGGDSLVAVRLIARIRERFGVRLPMRRVFDDATLEGMARLVEGHIGEAGGSPSVRAETGP